MTSVEHKVEMHRLATARRNAGKPVFVLANDHTAFDLADHLADVMPEMVDGRRIWDMPAIDLAVLAAEFYPGGVDALQDALEEV